MPPKDRTPANHHYCREVNCQYRHGNKCTEDECIKKGGEKWANYYTQHGRLADGDGEDA